MWRGSRAIACHVCDEVSVERLVGLGVVTGPAAAEAGAHTGTGQPTHQKHTWSLTNKFSFLLPPRWHHRLRLTWQWCRVWRTGRGRRGERNGAKQNHRPGRQSQRTVIDMYHPLVLSFPCSLSLLCSPSLVFRGLPTIREAANVHSCSCRPRRCAPCCCWPTAITRLDTTDDRRRNTGTRREKTEKV